MHWNGFRLTAAAALCASLLVGSLVATPAAKAAITASNITTPTDPSFFSADYDAPAQAFAISGTTSGGVPGTDQVDIRCYYDGGTASAIVASGVTTNLDGSFSVPDADLGNIGDRVCTLRAVPAGTAPGDLTPFAGPRVGVGERSTSTVGSGPNAGQPFDYYIWGQQLTGAFDYDSVSECGLDDGYLFDATLTRTSITFYCNAALFAPVSPGPARSELQIDGVNAYAPEAAERINSSAAGLPLLTLSYSVDPATGNLVIHETDPLVKCPDSTYPPTAVSCPSFVSAGVTDNRTITQDHDGHISWINDVFASTDGQAHSLDLLWDNNQRFQDGSHDSTQLEYEFPGESAYSMHVADDMVTLPSSPGTILVRMHGVADGDMSTGQGALVYDRPATDATFRYIDSVFESFMLHQTGTVPAGGSTRFRFAYVHDYQAANVASMAQAASTAFLNTLTVARSGNGSGTVTSSPGGISCGSTCSQAYPYGTSITLTAAASTGSAFSGWSGACAGSGSCTVMTNDATSVTATFSLIPEMLTVTKKGGGTGTVTSAPAGISCGASCSHSYDYGTSVSLSAKAGKGSAFTGWSGACSGKAVCTVSMNAVRSLQATFLRNCVVPNVKGMGLKKAKRAISSHACRVGKVTHAFSAKVKNGHVISQKPKPHKQLQHGAKVGLVVSKGKAH